ncbi:hypothetical protein [Maritalea sp. S77]|uniref:hypothetical protein n=1 Tax=Maritalea sp. S77 TaxID=3415125 RepID=UPI003C7C2657
MSHLSPSNIHPHLYRAHLAIGRFLIASVLSLTLANGAFAVDEHVDRFFTACVGSLPDFSSFAETLPEHGYSESSKGTWTGSAPEFPIMSLQIEPNSRICSLALMGNHADEFVDAVQSRLLSEPQWRYQKKVHNGRFIYLVQTNLGLTILEVVPPLGASTFLLSHSRD